MDRRKPELFRKHWGHTISSNPLRTILETYSRWRTGASLPCLSYLGFHLGLFLTVKTTYIETRGNLCTELGPPVLEMNWFRVFSFEKKWPVFGLGLKMVKFLAVCKRTQQLPTLLGQQYPPYWCSKTMKRRPYWCTKKILWESNSFLM